LLRSLLDPSLFHMSRIAFVKRSQHLRTMYGISDKADRRQFWNDDAPCKKFDMQRRLQHSSYVVSSIHSFLRETEHTVAVAIPSLVMKQAAELDVASTLTYNQSDEIIHVLEEEPSAGR